MARRGRGRPKGSKNKPKAKATASKTTTGRRGRPKGSKNKANSIVDSGVNQLVSKTEELASDNGKKLAQGESLVEEKVVEVEETEEGTHLGATRAEHTHSSYHSAFKSYIVDREGYALDKFAKSLKGGDYFSGSILVRAMCDYEQRLNFYLTHSGAKNKKAFKEAIYKDMEILKQRIESM
jgi:hypothetical protein